MAGNNPFIAEHRDLTASHVHSGMVLLEAHLGDSVALDVVLTPDEVTAIRLLLGAMREAQRHLVEVMYEPASPVREVKS